MDAYCRADCTHASTHARRHAELNEDLHRPRAHECVRRVCETHVKALFLQVQSTNVALLSVNHHLNKAESAAAQTTGELEESKESLQGTLTSNTLLSEKRNTL